MRQADKKFFPWFGTFVGIVLIMFCVLCYVVFCSRDSFVTVRGNEFPIELRGQVIDIKVNNEAHQYLQYRTSGFKNSFQLTHWQGCKYCQEKEASTIQSQEN